MMDGTNPHTGDRASEIAEALDSFSGVLGEKFLNFLGELEVFFPNIQADELVRAIRLYEAKDVADLARLRRARRKHIQLVKG